MVGRVYHRWTHSKQVPEELLTQSASFQKLIPEDDRVLIIGDSSPNIYLYYLHRKGVFLHGRGTPNQIDYYRDRGFKWIVSENRGSELLIIGDMIKKTGTVGNFSIYRIQ